MAKIINDPYARGVGAELGQQFSQQFNTGIQNLANLKMEQIHKNELGKNLRSLGLPAELASLPERDRQLFIQQYLQSSPSQGQQGGYQAKSPEGNTPGIPFGEQIRGQSEQKNEANRLRRQSQIQRHNAPFLKGNAASYENAERSQNILNQMRDLVNTGKVAEGISGRFKPGFLQNTETQVFDKLSNELAGLLSQQLGVPTNAKIKFAQSQKPNIEQNRKTQLQLIDKLLNETQKPLLRNEITQRLIAENGYEEPDNLEHRVNAMAKMYQHNPEFMQRADQGIQGAPQGRPSEPQEESFLGTLGRGAVRSGARIAGSIGGGLGDIVSAGLGLANYATGGATPTYGELQERAPILKAIPTSENLKDLFSRISNGYTDANSGVEEFFDDVLGTATSLAGPAGVAKGLAKAGVAGKAASAANKATKVLLPFSGITDLKKAAKLSVAGQLGSEAAGLFGAGPTGQSLTKAAVMIGYGTKGFREKMSDLKKSNYQAAEQVLDKYPIDGKEILDATDDLKKLAARSASPEKSILDEVVSKSESALKNGFQQTHPNIPFSEAAKTYPIKAGDVVRLGQDIGQYQNLKSYKTLADQKSLPKELRRYITRYNRSIKNTLSQIEKNKYAGTSVAEKAEAVDAYKKYLIAEDLHMGEVALGDLSRWLKDTFDFDTLFKNGSVRSFFEGITFGPGLVAREAALLKNLLQKSPVARAEFFETLKAASKESKPAFLQHAAKLDKIAQRYEK